MIDQEVHGTAVLTDIGMNAEIQGSESHSIHLCLRSIEIRAISSIPASMALVSRSLVLAPRTEIGSAFSGETASFKSQTVQPRALHRKNGTHGVARAVHAAEPVNAIKSVEKAFKSAETGWGS